MAGIDFPALAPEEAIAYFKAKGFDFPKTFAWQDMWQTDHATAFTVAKSTNFDILKDIHTSLANAMQNGQTFEQWKKTIIPTLQDKGWWGRKTMIDPDNPDAGPQDVQLGSLRRLRTIFDVNTRMAHAAGRWNQIERAKGDAPWLRYTAVLDSKTRPLHALWHGTVLPFNHPWWDTHFPPNGWFCRCTVQQMSNRDLTRYGFKPSDGPKDDGPPKTYTNPRTGEVSTVPNGIDPGFAYNPGKTAFEAHAARVAATKWIDAPPGLTAAAQAESVKYMLPALVQDFGTWVDQIAAGTTSANGDRRVVGALTDPVLKFLDAKDLAPESGAITVADKDVLHFIRDLKQGLNKAPSDADLKAIPESLADPQVILFDADKQNLLYVVPSLDDPKSVKLVVEINVSRKVPPKDGQPRATVVTNTMPHMSRLNPQILQGDQNRYEVVWGSW